MAVGGPRRDLAGVVHTAGVLDDGVVTAISPERLAGVLAPKADAAWHLHEATAGRDLDLFVVYSSVAGVLGSPGQAAYAAANTFLDALAAYRRQAGLPAASLAWGMWDTAGMAATVGDADRARSARAGISPMSADTGLDLFDAALAAGRPAVVPAVLDVPAMRSRVVAGRVPSLLRVLLGAVPTRRQAGHGNWADRIAGLDPQDARDQVDALVRGLVAQVLGHGGADAVPADRAFRELGFDSLTAVDLRNRVNAATGLRLASTLVFDYPTPRILAGQVYAELAGNRAATVTPAEAATTTGLDDPIAIVGLACRFPGGADNPDQLWELLATGGDGISEFPADRGWDLDTLFDPDPANSGTSYTRHGGFLYGAAEFDPGFFGISPREALAMDPQQRLLLEASWEAFESAGLDPHRLRGSRTGVFAGVMYHDYASRLMDLPAEVEGYIGTGTSGSVLSGRVAYTFGLEGPAVTVDTACSSSLVALHLAAQALRSGECDLALAGGVTVMATPGTFVEFSRQRGLSQDGRCKSFAAAADGTGWGEGVGVLLVQRLSDAQRDGRRVHAIVRGTAVNQDGASNGLTAPNGPSQQRVIRQALANARLTAADVDAVEAHGTGTTLGDPIEAQALLATYGQDRPADRPLLLGSIKSNIGHTQAAAGVAGVIKMVLALRHGLVPPTLHVDEPSPHIDWTAGAVALATEATPWPAVDRPRRAAVSSFGISGTNAHVVLEQAPEPAVAAESRPGVAADAGLVPFVLSAADRAALREQAARLRAHLAAHPEVEPAEVGHALATTRAAFGHRAVVLGQDRAELAQGLTALVDGETVAGVVTGAALRNTAPVFVFSGHGSQWPGMAVDLLDSSPVFAASIAECEAVLTPWVDWSLTDVLRGAEGAPPLVASGVVQPALWAVMVSLARLWRSLGVRPGGVVGHSQGEIAAACVAGALTLEDAAKIVALRSQVLVDIAGRGGMVSVALPADRARDLLKRWAGRLSVAVVNGPGSVVVAGDVADLADLVAACAADGVRTRGIDVEYASHSPQVEAVADRLLASLDGITPRPAELPFYSALTGEQTDTTTLDAGYWYRNLRETVNFEQAVRNLLADGHQVFLEVGPHPVLSFGMQETIDAAEHEAAVVNTLRRGDGGWARILTALAELHVRGVEADWNAVCGVRTGPAVPLPTYAFHRQRYWPEAPVRTGPAAAVDDPADRQFWDAVERADADALAAAMRIDTADARALGDALPLLSSWRQRRRDESTVDAWRYRVQWTPLTAAASAALGGTWLLVAPAEHAGQPIVGQVVQALGEAGADVTPLAVADADRAALAARLADVDAAAVTGVLSLLALDETPHPQRPVVPAGLAGTLALVQALGDAGITAPLWCATGGAVSTGRADPLDHPRQALVWGLGRVAALEHADRWGGLVDLPAKLDRRARGRLAAVLAGVGHEDQVAVRTSGLFARRLARAAADPAPQRPGWRP
ncbi:type I polyketide synthase, partial [Micromonospora carbonacea]|uniref:type I polyketide synthase n=1 Tax=Micromonospora carbonacea TaxID=47853 RepID=UPI0033D7CD76